MLFYLTAEGRLADETSFGCLTRYLIGDARYGYRDVAAYFIGEPSRRAGQVCAIQYNPEYKYVFFTITLGKPNARICYEHSGTRWRLPDP